MAEMEIIKETIKIREDRIQYLSEGIAKINKKARKMGCEPLVLKFDLSSFSMKYMMKNGQVVESEDIHKFPSYNIRRVWRVLDATLEYIIPVIDGWELISTFDIMDRLPEKNEDGTLKLDDDGNTIYGERLVFTSTVPGRELPAEYLDKNEIHCDHCGHRRFRTHSMLMRNIETSEYKEVGSTCVKDFFGHDPKNLMWMAQLSFEDIYREIDEDMGEGGRYEELLYLDAVLTYTALAIRKDGWVSKQYARDYDKTSTAEMMYFYMFPPENTKQVIPDPNDDDKKLAKDTIKYFEGLSDHDSNDYIANCCKLVKLGYVPYKMVGVACSMIASYKKYYKDYLERQERPESNWVGDVGGKVEVNVKCLFSKEIQTDFGVSVLYVFVDESTGNKFKTFYSGSKWSVYQGDTMTLKGTVKKHEEYSGEKNTNLTRCSVSNVIEAPEEGGDG